MRGKTGFLVVAALLGFLLTACAAEPTPTRVELLRPLSTIAPTLSMVTQSALTPTYAAIAAPPASTPAPTVLSTLTPIPAPRLRQLTSGGCCTNPFWSADGQQVQFIDRPASRPVGIYGVQAKNPGPPALVTQWIVNTSGGGAFYVYPDGNTTVVQRAATGEKYTINNGGRPVSVSPDGERILWQVIGQRGDFDRRRNQTWVANVDGSDAQVVVEAVGLDQSQWFDGERILVVGSSEDPSTVSIAILTLDTGEWLELTRVSPPKDVSLSPGGSWLLYFLAFQDDPNDDGLWIVPTDGSQLPRKLDFFGSYRWRDDAHLLYIPLEVGPLGKGGESHALWAYDVLGDERQRLTDPEQTTFKVANNDWSVSPDGRHVVFVSAVDHNLWLIDLNP